MPNKHFCQGPECHTNPTTDRFLKSKGIIRGRYAVAVADNASWHARAKYFCSQRCESDWLNVNMDNIRQNIPVTFIRHRRITEGYEKVTEKTHYGRSYTHIRKIDLGVDNNTEQ